MASVAQEHAALHESFRRNQHVPDEGRSPPFSWRMRSKNLPRQYTGQKCASNLRTSASLSRSTLQPDESKQQIPNLSDVDNGDYVVRLRFLYQQNIKAQPRLKIKNQTVEMLVDSEAMRNILDQATFNKLRCENSLVPCAHSNFDWVQLEVVDANALSSV